MRILQLCHKPPFPEQDGGCMAMAAITRGLMQEQHQVDVLCMSTHKHPWLPEQIPADVRQHVHMMHVPMDVRVTPWGAFRNLFTDESYNISRFYSAQFEQALVAQLRENEYDIIQMESLFCTPYLNRIRANSGAKVVLRAHNVEHLIWERLAAQEKYPIKGSYLKLLAKRLKVYEAEVSNGVDGIAAITPQDVSLLRSIGVKVPMVVIPMGVHMSIEAVSTPALPLRAYHLGSMDWQPNVEAMEWLVNDIWPAITKAMPDVSCHLAGRHMPQELLKKNAQHLHIQGEVVSAGEFAAPMHLMLVPLLSGGGMRIKIVEAMAMGKVVISTTIGAEGIPYTEGAELLIADSSEAFVAQLRRLNDRPELIRQIGRNARLLAESQFELASVTARLTYFYRSIL